MAIPKLDAFQVIADPSRREILLMLSRDSYNINKLSENFDMSRPAVSKHIAILESAGFVTIKDIGRERHCMLNQDGFNEVKKWINHFDKFWDNKLKNLEMLLRQQQHKKKNAN